MDPMCQGNLRRVVDSVDLAFVFCLDFLFLVSVFHSTHFVYLNQDSPSFRDLYQMSASFISFTSPSHSYSTPSIPLFSPFSFCFASSLAVSNPINKTPFHSLAAQSPAQPPPPAALIGILLPVSVRCTPTSLVVESEQHLPASHCLSVSLSQHR